MCIISGEHIVRIFLFRGLFIFAQMTFFFSCESCVSGIVKPSLDEFKDIESFNSCKCMVSFFFLIPCVPSLYRWHSVSAFCVMNFFLLTKKKRWLKDCVEGGHNCNWQVLMDL